MTHKHAGFQRSEINVYYIIWSWAHDSASSLNEHDTNRKRTLHERINPATNSSYINCYASCWEQCCFLMPLIQCEGSRSGRKSCTQRSKTQSGEIRDTEKQTWLIPLANNVFARLSFAARSSKLSCGCFLSSSQSEKRWGARYLLKERYCLFMAEWLRDICTSSRHAVTEWCSCDVECHTDGAMRFLKDLVFGSASCIATNRLHATFCYLFVR